MIKECILGRKGSRSEERRRAFVLGEDFHEGMSSAHKEEADDTIRKLVDWMAVDDTPNRWTPRGSATYCNVYVADAVDKLGGYVPRCWWTRRAIKAMQNGEDVEATYPSSSNIGTVIEMNANSLHDWFVEWGESFGWNYKVVDRDDPSAQVLLEAEAKDLQERLNEDGRYGMIVGRRRQRHRSGHITLCFSDAVCEEEAVSGIPLQSQAGTINRRYFADDWYFGSRFDSICFVWKNTPGTTVPSRNG